jgi:hypothetical protein
MRGQRRRVGSIGRGTLTLFGWKSAVRMRRRGMDKEEIFKLIEDNGLTLHGDIEHFSTLLIDAFYAKYLEQPVGYLCENAVGHKYFRLKKPSSVYKPVALYAKDES